MKNKAFQRGLDKQRLSWYNSRGKQRKPVTEEDILSGKLSKDIDETKNVLSIISDIGEALRTIPTKGVTPAPPILAGGAIRDLVFGLTPKDYDIFIDTSGVPLDEREDLVLLVGSYFLEEMVKKEKFLGLSLDLVRKGEVYRKANPKKDFIVYENSKDTLAGIQFQFIGHNDHRLTEDPPAFLEEFDWPLVKALYNPEDASFFFDKEFFSLLSSKEYTTDSHETFCRIKPWLDKFHYRGWGAPFKLNRGKNYETPSFQTGKYNIQKPGLQEWARIAALENRFMNMMAVENQVEHRFVIDIEADARN